MTLVEVLVVIAILAALAGIAIPAVMKARDASRANGCRNNLRQIGIALHHHQANFAKLPPGCNNWSEREPFPHMSWLTRLLPYLEHQALWQETVQAFAIERFFGNVPPHTGLQTRMPGFICPSDNDADQLFQFARFKVAFTSYLGVEGTDQAKKDGLLYLNSRTSFNDCPDGLSNTVVSGERPPSEDKVFGWWYAGWGQSKDGSVDMLLGARENAVDPSFRYCPSESNHFHQGRATYQCDALHYWSYHSGGAHFLLADGAVRFLTYSADSVLPALATRAGGETVDLRD
jgi:prepilin-type processing-associated H-X9-DG protein